MNCPNCQIELTADGLTGMIACPGCNHEFQAEAEESSPESQVDEQAEAAADPLDSPPPDSETPVSDESTAEDPVAEIPIAEVVEDANTDEEATSQPTEPAAAFEIAAEEAPIAQKRLQRRGLLDFFDLKFERYLTPLIIRIYWAMALLCGAGLFVYRLIAFLREMSARGPRSDEPGLEFKPPFDIPGEVEGGNWIYDDMLEIGYYLLLLAGFIAFMLFIRLMCELVMVFFDISKSLKEIKNRPPDSAQERP